MQWMKNFGPRFDGELVRYMVETSDFALDPPAGAALLLPAVQIAWEAAGGPASSDKHHKDWIDTRSVDASVSHHGGGADDRLPDTIICSIDGNGEGTRIAELLPDRTVWKVAAGVRVTDGDTVSQFGFF